ncbi:MAG: hypothetical protein HOP07_10380 [Bacteriovoracaceae bacterium]|nr:hypothetical protein [Bacteriovoracaceae bacterium]
MKIRKKDLCTAEIVKIQNIVERLRELQVQSPEEWLISDPHSLEFSHVKQVTEIILCELGVMGYRQKRIGATQVLYNIDLDVFADFYIKNNFSSLAEQRCAFPKIFNHSNNNIKKRMRDQILKRYREDFCHITNSEIINYILKEKITRIRNIPNPVYINIIQARAGLRKKVVTLLREQCLKKQTPIPIPILDEKKDFQNTYSTVTSENIGKYLRKNDIRNRQECLNKNRYIYRLIFFSKTTRHLNYILQENIWRQDDLLKPSRKKILMSVFEIANILCEKIKQDSLSPDISLFKVDKKLAVYLDGQKVYWAVKAYVLIRFGLLQTSKTNYIYKWDQKKVQLFLSILKLTPASPLLPKFLEFMESRRIYL